MADEDPTGQGAAEPPSPKAEDLKTERAVLALLLHEHPAQLTMDELILVLHADPDRDNPNDEGERAVKELISVGLVHRNGRFLMPSRAALYFERLEAN